MPANITQTNGKDEMMYVGETPWHGLGVRLNNPATSEEAIVAAGLDWKIETRPIYYMSKDGFHIEVPEKKAIVREDTLKIFNVLSSSYTPVQNKDAFSFFDGLVGGKQAIYHTAGSLGQGERVWILAKLPGMIQVTKEDVIEKYLLLATSHDGSKALTMQWTPVRVVCQNTLNLALSEGADFYHRHTTNIFNNLNKTRNLLGLANVYFNNLTEGINRLIQKQLTEEYLKTFVKYILAVPEEEELSERYSQTRDKADEILALVELGKGNNLPGVRDTRWAAMNAVTEYVDYLLPNRANSQNKRLESAWFGKGAEMKQKTWDYLLTKN